MKAEEIIVGGVYIAKVSRQLVPCKVLRITKQEAFRAPPLSGRRSRSAKTFYAVENLRTGRETTFRSASKFRRVVRLAECDHTKQFEEKVEGLKPKGNPSPYAPNDYTTFPNATTLPKEEWIGPWPDTIDRLARALADRLVCQQPAISEETARLLDLKGKEAVKGWLERYCRSDLARYFAETELAPTT